MAPRFDDLVPMFEYKPETNLYTKIVLNAQARPQHKLSVE